MNFDLNFKENLHRYCVALVQEKLAMLQQQINARKNDLESASKSSAGDKHETARAMIHLEQEKLGMQFMDVEKQRNLLSQIVVSTYSTIQSGTLIITDKAIFYISVGLGKVLFNEQDIYVISPVSPLAQAFLYSKSLETIVFQSSTYNIISIS
tara:strand:- start:208 stop:666 length:459 start_codon:yes stop_codon:yes gene_type:complete